MVRLPTLLRTLLWLAGLAVLLGAPPARAELACDDTPLKLNSDITIDLDSSAEWQPLSGAVRFTLDSKTQSLKGLQPLVCFRWAAAGGTYAKALVQVVSFTSDDKSGHALYEATVPEKGLPDFQWSWGERISNSLAKNVLADHGEYDNMFLVPRADMQIIAVGADGNALAKRVEQVGVTSIWAARAIAAAAAILALLILFLLAWKQNIPGRWPIMRLISTRNGFASLSRFQVLIWSFLIGTGAVYVMALSGSLLDIPARALVLLGIAAGTTIGSKIQSANADAAAAHAGATPPAVAAAPNAVTAVTQIDRSHEAVALSWTAPAAGATPASYRVDFSRTGSGGWRIASATIAGTSFRIAGLEPNTAYDFQVYAVNAAGTSPASAAITIATMPAPAQPRQPLWSALVISPDQPGEIDVTRVQLLFFTMISAGFVMIRLFNSYVFPDIPDGFMLLMGISNGAYLSAKFVR